MSVSPEALDISAHLIDRAPTQEPTPIDWSALFGNDHPVELEIGSGKGLFLANAGLANPSRNFLGVELSKKYAHQAAERIAKKSLANVKVLPGDARQFLHQFVPPNSVLAVHIYFPDPWWKKRHKKRRVFCEEFVVDVANALLPGGHFHIATDVEEYFGVMMALMSSHPEFATLPTPEPTSPSHELDYLTSFERKYRLEGRSIYRAAYQKIASDERAST